MELLFDMPLWLVLSITALFAGFIDAIVGGGGLLTVPALLSAGLPPHLALGTNKLAATFSSATSSLTYYRQNLFSPGFWRYSFYATAIGAVIGTLAVYLVDAGWLEKILPVLIFATAIYTLFRRNGDSEETRLPPDTPATHKKQWAQGMGLGFYDGFAGPGTGAFWTVSSQILYKMDILRSCGLARSMNFISNITSLLTFMLLAQVDYRVGLSMGVCLMVGAYIGAHSAIKYGGNLIRPLFILVVLAMSGKLAWDAW